MDPLPGAIITPLGKVVIDGLPGWILAWQQAPGAAAFELVEDGIEVLPRRWVIERTFAWLCKSRRLSKDYEFLPQSSECMIYLTMTRLMLKRLGKMPIK